MKKSIVYKLLSLSLSSLIIVSNFTPVFSASWFSRKNNAYHDISINDKSAGTINVKLQQGLDLKSTKAVTSSSSLPSSYSSVTAGKVSSAKNQGNYGTCWAFSATSACEASLNNKTGSLSDLSELQLAYYFYNTKKDPLGNCGNDKTECLEDTCLDQGGNHIFTIWSLASWVNGTTETVLPYTSVWQTKALNATIEDEYANDYDIAHLQNAYIIPYSSSDETSRNNVKQAILDYGQVSCSYYHSSSNYNSTYGSYYTTTTGTNHAVSIVGWCDDYPKEYFGKWHRRPSGDGAWLVKNSWGTDWGTDGDADSSNSGQEGYFWISYYDKSLNSSSRVYVFDFDTNSEYQYNYQYDGSCGTETRTVLTGNSYCANYTIKGLTSEAELLKAVGVGLNTTNVSGAVTIRKDIVDDNPLSGEVVSTQTFSTTYSGFYTIDLDNPVVLDKGTNYSVCFDFNSSVSVYVDSTYTNGSWISFTADTTNDKTYVVNSETITSLANSNQTGRIKAYTVDCQPLKEEYDVTYHADGATNVPDNQIKIETEDLILADNIPTKTGYKFIGWDTSESATTVVYNPGDTYKLDQPLDLYAVWLNTYNVNYHADNATNIPSQQVKVQQEDLTLSDKIPEKTGYNFLGWDTNESATTVVYNPNDTYKLDQSLDLYAVWQKIVIKSLTTSPTSINLEEDEVGKEVSIVVDDKTIDHNIIVENASYADGKYTINGLEITIEDDIATITVTSYIQDQITVTFKDSESNLTTDLTVNVTKKPEPIVKTIDVNVTVTKVTKSKNTSYKVNIETQCTNTKVGKVQYSTNGGKKWLNGSSLTSKEAITSLLIRITDSEGQRHVFSYQNGVVTKQ